MNDNRILLVIFVCSLFLVIGTTHISAQNITDLSVKKEVTGNDLDLSDLNSTDEDIFAYPRCIKYDNRCFQIDGHDTFICSGTFHYFRVAKPLWSDRFQKLKAAGFNCVETYVPWNWHEREMPNNVSDFSKVNMDDLIDFLKMATQFGFYVILRPGPYICAEWSGGGFPQWLMQKRPAHPEYNTWLQSDDSEFVKWSQHWYQAVCRVAAPYQVTHRPSGSCGVILFQIENEYERVNWLPHEAKRKYLEYLADAARVNGIDVPIVSCWTSESRNVSSGPLKGVVDMVNSYPRWQVAQRFGGQINPQLQSQPGKPLISGELQGGWCCELGWQDFWKQDGLAPVQTQNLTLYALQRGFSAINYYMVVGGTNFDDWAARQQITSYDYAAAIGEDGSTNERYRRMQGLTALMLEYGTRIARSSLQNIVYTSSDPQVQMALRMADNGDRYYFIRTEDRSKGHFGTIYTDSLALDFALEPFGSMIYYMSAGNGKGLWLPQMPEPAIRKKIVAPSIAIKKIGEWTDGIPTTWTKLKVGETIDDKGYYGRHFVYYKTIAREGCGLEVERIGKGVVNGSAADTVLVSVNRKLVPIDYENKNVACYHIPGDSVRGKKVEVIMLFENRGLHHHTNASVEKCWKTGPEYVRSGGKDLALSFAYHEDKVGMQCSHDNLIPCDGNNPLLKWWKYQFNMNGKQIRPLYVNIEQFGNGFIYINGHCIGRCWEQGPQRNYYIPECWLYMDKPNIMAISLRPTPRGAVINSIQIK